MRAKDRASRRPPRYSMLYGRLCSIPDAEQWDHDFRHSSQRHAGTSRHPHHRGNEGQAHRGDGRRWAASQPGGVVHGGALAAFADDLGGALAGLNAAKRFRTATIESKTNIFRACPPGRLTGVAVPVHVGRRTIVLQTSIYRADGKLAAMMIQTQMVVPREPKRTADAAS
jgi:uncharacterized protein (TIGR00369 family)